jgi:hypothetical protein
VTSGSGGEYDMSDMAARRKERGDIQWEAPVILRQVG